MGRKIEDAVMLHCGREHDEEEEEGRGREREKERGICSAQNTRVWWWRRRLVQVLIARNLHISTSRRHHRLLQQLSRPLQSFVACSPSPPPPPPSPPLPLPALSASPRLCFGGHTVYEKCDDFKHLHAGNKSVSVLRTERL